MKIDKTVQTETLPQDGWFKVTKRFNFDHPYTGPQYVPVGFTTDFASIPRLFRRIITVNGKHREESLPHDLAYFLKGNFPNGVKITRKQADKMFYDFLKLDKGIARWKAWSMYRAVRAGGWVYWNKK